MDEHIIDLSIAPTPPLFNHSNLEDCIGKARKSRLDGPISLLLAGRKDLTVFHCCAIVRSRVESLELRNTNLTDEMLCVLTLGKEYLKNIWISHACLTNQGLKELKSLENLQTLLIDDLCNESLHFKTSSLYGASWPQLTSLTLLGHGFTFGLVKNIVRTSKQLTTLCLTGSSYDQQGLEIVEIKRLLPLLVSFVLNSRQMVNNYDRGKNALSVGQKRVFFENCTELTISDFSEIVEKGVEALSLRTTNTTDEMLKVLGTSESLEWLELRRSPITDRGVQMLRGLGRLKHLNIHAGGASSLSNAALVYADQWVHLESLILSGHSFTNQALIYAAAKWSPSFHTLSLNGAPFDDGVIGELPLNIWPCLASLSLGWSSGFTDHVLEHVAERWSGLTDLYLGGPSFSCNNLPFLIAKLPRLCALMLEGIADMPRESFDCLKSCAHLSTLKLYDCKTVCEEWLPDHMAECWPRLNVLTLFGEFGNAAIKKAVNLDLARLFIGGKRVDRKLLKGLSMDVWPKLESIRVELMANQNDKKILEEVIKKRWKRASSVRVLLYCNEG